MIPIEGMEFFLDSSRCIGCKACVQACGECETHRGRPMIHLEYVNRGYGVQTSPVVCMHCEDPMCAHVCPADAIKKTPDGVVQSPLKPRCIGCSNCALACPFGVPEYQAEYDLMMKCDMCYDRTSVGKRPMCATVCPSGALFFGEPSEIKRSRRETPVREFQFGNRTVRTKVHMMTAPGANHIDFDVLSHLTNDGIKPSGDAFDAADWAIVEEIP